MEVIIQLGNDSNFGSERDGDGEEIVTKNAIVQVKSDDQVKDDIIHLYMLTLGCCLGKEGKGGISLTSLP